MKRLLPLLFRALFILNVGLTLGNVGLMVIAARQGLFWRADFTALYTGGTLVQEGQGAHLYDFDVQTRYQQKILEGRSFKDGLLPFDYPPHTALFFAPLSYLPRVVAFDLWLIVQLTLLAWLVRLLLDLTVEWSAQERWLLLSAVLALPPLLLTFMLGSFSLLLLLCLLKFYQTLKHGMEPNSGWWLVLGSLKPQSILLPGLILIGAWRWRALKVIVFAGIALLVICVLILSPQVWVDFIKTILKVGGLFDKMGVVLVDMYNFKGLLASVLGKDSLILISGASLVALFAAAGGTLWIWHFPWDTSEPEFELRLALTMGLGLFFSLHLYPQDSLMWVAPALLCYIYLRRRALPRKRYALFVLTWPLLMLLEQFGFRGRLGVRVPILAMAVLLCWMGWLLLVSRLNRRDLENEAF